jgi:hypothetical protein
MGGPPLPPGDPGDEGDGGTGAAAAKARELIAELSGQRGPSDGAPTIPSQSPAGGPLPPAPPGAPAAPYLPPGSPVPSFGDAGGRADLTDPTVPLPSYLPAEPPGLGFPSADPPPVLPAVTEEAASTGQWSDGSAPPPRSRTRRSRVGSPGGPVGDGATSESDGDGDGPGQSRRLPVLLLLLVVLLGGAYLVKTQLLDDSSPGTAANPPVHASATPAAGRKLGAAELAASLKDPHFKHGYEAGQKRGTVAPADRASVCRAMALSERASGYPWGAHDQAGCLVALVG